MGDKKNLHPGGRKFIFLIDFREIWYFLKVKTYIIMIHIRLCGRLSDKKFHPADFRKQDYFFLPLWDFKCYCYEIDNAAIQLERMALTNSKLKSDVLTSYVLSNFHLGKIWFSCNGYTFSCVVGETCMVIVIINSNNNLLKTIHFRVFVS